MKVLMIDDEPSFLELSKEIIEGEAGLSVYLASSGVEAMKMLERESYDVIVSDYMMSGMNGIQLLESLRARGDRTPFILFTGHGREEIAIQALNKGANFYLQKGGDPTAQFADLINVIRQAHSRRKAEEAVEHNARRFRSLIENSSDLVCLIDGQGTIQYLSPSTGMLLGREPEKMIGIAIEEIFHPDDIAIFHDSAERLMENPGLIERKEIRIRHGDGSWRIMEANITADTEIDNTHLIINARDVTERKRMEDTLLESRKEIELILDNLMENVIYKDRESRIIWVNRSAAKSLGMQPEELVGRFCYEMWHGRDSPCENCPVIEAMETGRPCTGEIPNPEGWRSVSGVPVYDAEGNVIGAVETALDITERKRAERALRESKERYRTIFENTGSASAVIMGDMTISLVNDQFVKLTGYSKEEIEGRMKFVGMMADEDRARMVDYHRRRRNLLPAPKEYEFHLLTKAGEIKECQILASIVPQTEESIVSVIDLTEIKRMRGELEEKNEEHSRILDSIDVQIWCATDPETYGFVNKARTDFLGITKEEFVGKKLCEVLPESVCSICMEGNRKAFLGEKVVNEEWITSKLGETRCLLVAKIPKFNEVGEVDYLVCTATDITELKNMERILQEEHEQILSIFESIDIPIYVADMETYELVFANQQVRDELGDDIVGRKCYRALMGRDAPCDFCTNDIIREKGGLPYYYVQHNPIIDRDYQCMTRMIRWQNGRDVHLSIAFDITDRMRMEEALRMANEKLNLMVSVTRHDILNELTVARGYLDLLKDPSRNDSAPLYLSKIQDALGRAENHLHFTREIEALGSEPATWMRVVDPLSRALSEIDLEKVQVEIDEYLEKIQIFSDTMIWKVFYNLAHNTMSHAKGVTRISFHAERRGEGLDILYEDDGSGIPKGMKKALFSYRPSTTPSHGLYLVREILQLNRMGITEEGKEGDGVRFRISISKDRWKET